MAVKKLVEVWDGKNILEDNILFLKQKTKKVHLPMNNNIKTILNDLLDTFKATPCSGIAANQIGYNKSIFVGLKDDLDGEAEISNKKTKTIVKGNPNAENFEFYINPQIDYSSKKSTQEGEEGCLSIPEIRIIAVRYDKIKVRYFNGNGEKIKKPLFGFMARLFQHELDHLNGILMVENSSIKSIYRISENENVEKLYVDLINKLSKLK